MSSAANTNHATAYQGRSSWGPADSDPARVCTPTYRDTHDKVVQLSHTEIWAETTAAWPTARWPREASQANR